MQADELDPLITALSTHRKSTSESMNAMSLENTDELVLLESVRLSNDVVNLEQRARVLRQLIEHMQLISSP